MIITYDYQIEYDSKEKGYRVRSKHAAVCPCCGQILSGYDVQKRTVIDDDGKPVLFLLRRLKCPSCRQLHLELPDIISPHKHYSAEVIRAALHSRRNSCPADDSTIRRWRQKK